MLASDLLLLALLPALAYALRFEGFAWSVDDWRVLIFYTLISLPLKVSIFVACRLYNRLWGQASLVDFVHVLRAALISAGVCAVLGAAVIPSLGFGARRVPLSVLFMDALATIAVLAAPRMGAKVTRSRRQVLRRTSDPGALIVGAGAEGESIARELLANPELGLRLVGFVDDDPRKRSQQLFGQPVLGSLAEIPRLLDRHQVSELIIAMPGAAGTVVREIVRAAIAAGVRTRIVPGLSEILTDRVSISALRNVEIQDLLRREPVTTDLAAVRAVVTGHTVLITGAGGSIGSELCRQLARLDPARLLLLGHGENSIFEIQNSLRDSHPELETIPLIADVRDTPHIRDLFLRYEPSAVFHAAAHKHVPLMENNVGEAVLNNVLGTVSVVAAAVEAGADHLVLVSSDKAVRPCSVMGITKRVAELVVQRAGMVHGRPFVSVRFGNVLGSRGSVVPTFLQQIRAGGPVLVTHPEMRRYFMTIPEAVQLVLQAGALGSRGEVFLLDMGEPVRIVDLASDLIRLSGLEPERDIQIRFTGLRPGERLAEEILFSGESVAPTKHPKVLRATNGHLPPGTDERIQQLIEAAQEQAPDTVIRALLAALVPEATSPAGDQLAIPIRAARRPVGKLESRLDTAV